MMLHKRLMLDEKNILNQSRVFVSFCFVVIVHIMQQVASQRSMARSSH
jgi:hypothetical protein